MSEMNFDKLTDKEKMEIFKNGELNFSSQDDKVKTINEIIEIIENLMSKHKNSSELNTYMVFKVIKYFLEEHRDVLEQYELDYNEESKDNLPEDIMEFPELRGYIWGWLSKYITEKKDFDGNEQAVKSVDFWLDWFVDRVSKLPHTIKECGFH